MQRGASPHLRCTAHPSPPRAYRVDGRGLLASPSLRFQYPITSVFDCNIYVRSFDRSGKRHFRIGILNVVNGVRTLIRLQRVEQDAGPAPLVSASIALDAPHVNSRFNLQICRSMWTCMQIH
ncbi:hypothetical protein EVAR_69298_1 [Eumeta japonica]|uniref:Uncharacterized protein n=1 Tax=Eumeta variegata TaxID=151549 RepID=A0A4C1SFV4_EUMVA|nr:hypothetical protein EVAR_69298_1 [Eumeta japonica]